MNKEHEKLKLVTTKRYKFHPDQHIYMMDTLKTFLNDTRLYPNIEIPEHEANNNKVTYYREKVLSDYINEDTWQYQLIETDGWSYEQLIEILALREIHLSIDKRIKLCDKEDLFEEYDLHYGSFFLLYANVNCDVYGSRRNSFMDEEADWSTQLNSDILEYIRHNGRIR